MEEYFRPALSSVREARNGVKSLRLPAELEDPAMLVVSELATNALLHTSGTFSLRIQAGSCLRIEVGDSSSQAPRLCGGGAFGGRGLAIVAALATRWGAEMTSTGKTVWAEVAFEPN